MIIDIVVCRFAETWEDVVYLYNMFAFTHGKRHTLNFIVYNKGEPYDGVMDERVKIIQQPNIGRETYTYLHHIYTNYNTLADITVFTMASWKQHDKKPMIINNIIENMERAGFVGFQYWHPFKDFYGFTIDSHSGSHPINNELCKPQTFTPSKIRPFGAWYEHNIPVSFKDCSSLFGIFSVHKNCILRYTIEQYNVWLDDISTQGPNPEIAHYWERTWYSLYA
jgi:hypothetical protein